MVLGCSGPVTFIWFGLYRGPRLSDTKGISDTFLAVVVYTHYLAAWLRCQGFLSTNGGLGRSFYSCVVGGFTIITESFGHHVA